MTHWLYKILASVGLKVQEANWFSVLFFSLLGKEVSRRNSRSFFLCSVLSTKLMLPHLWLWLQTSLRTEGTITNGHFVEGVRFASNKRSAVSLGIGTTLPRHTAGLWHLEISGWCAPAPDVLVFVVLPSFISSWTLAQPVSLHTLKCFQYLKAGPWKLKHLKGVSETLS